MHGRDWVALIAGLSIIIWICAWLLVSKLRHHFRLQKIRDQEVLERKQARVPRQRELWPWPPRSKYQPGEWAGPTKTLLRFLHTLNPPGWKPTLQFYGYVVTRENYRRKEMRCIRLNESSQ